MTLHDAALTVSARLAPVLARVQDRLNTPTATNGQQPPAADEARRRSNAPE